MHSDAPTAADTDWRQILALYDQLLAVTPTPVVALNRAVALAEVDGPGIALATVDRARPGRLRAVPHHPRRPAGPPGPARGGAARRTTARSTLTANEAERRFLLERRNDLAASTLSKDEESTG